MSEQSPVLPMFPLGSVLFPHGVLALRVFEPRYLQLMQDCLDGGKEFGVVLIERGSEVGGGDSRFDFGTVARIVEVAQLDDGHLAVIAVGDRPVRVEAWLPDDPYPQAFVVPATPPDLAGGERDLVAQVEGGLRKVYALYSELGYDVGNQDFVLADNPTDAAFQVCALAPVGSLDAQRLLEAGTTEARLRGLAEWLVEETAVLEARLAGK